MSTTQEAKVHDTIYLETLPHGNFRVLVSENCEYPITESRHVMCDESRCPGAPEIFDIMDEEMDESDLEE